VSSNVSERQAREVAEAAREAEWKLPSFAKQLFLGNLRLDLIHPQPGLDPQAVEKGERFLAQLREFLESEVDPLEIEREARIPEHVIDGLKGLGALGMKVSEEYGGLGLSRVYYNRALALAGVWHASLSGLLSAHQSIGVAEPLRLFGTEQEKRKWLPLVATDRISAFLLTEPDVGSDPARLASTATPVDGGYVLNGRKLWATNGAIADIVVVMAQVPKGEGRRVGSVRSSCPTTPGGRRRPARAGRGRQGPRGRGGGAPARSTPNGCRSLRSARARARAPTMSSGRWRRTCATSSEPRASWRGRSSTP
jgi:alkylation response protein AidB-like acyl-CoA dehydrogenase